MSKVTKFHALKLAVATLKEKNIHLDPVIEARIQQELAMLQDPLVKATHKAYKESRTYQVDQLYAEHSRWSRKLTIARNKLAEVNNRIELLLVELAKELDGGKDE